MSVTKVSKGKDSYGLSFPNRLPQAVLELGIVVDVYPTDPLRGGEAGQDDEPEPFVRPSVERGKHSPVDAVHRPLEDVPHIPLVEIATDTDVTDELPHIA